MQWATVTEFPDRDTKGIKCAAFSDAGLYAADRTGVLRWHAASASFELMAARSKDEMVQVLLPVGEDRLWCGLGSGKLVIYDTETFKEHKKIGGAHAAEVTCLCLSHSGLAVFSASADFTLKSWDSGNGRQLSSLSVHHSSVRTILAVPFSEEESLAITGGADGAVVACKERAGKLVEDEDFHSVAAPSGVASMVRIGERYWMGHADGRVSTWDAAGLTLLGDAKANRDSVSAIAEMGDVVWTGGADRQVLCWDAASRSPRLLYSLGDQGGYVKAMLRIGWGLWTFSSKNLRVLTSESIVDGHRKRLEQLEAERERLEAALKGEVERRQELQEEKGALEREVEGLNAEMSAVREQALEEASTLSGKASSEAAAHRREVDVYTRRIKSMKHDAHLLEQKVEAAEKAEAEQAERERALQDQIDGLEKEMRERAAAAEDTLKTAQREGAALKAEAERTLRAEVEARAEELRAAGTAAAEALAAAQKAAATEKADAEKALQDRLDGVTKQMRDKEQELLSLGSRMTQELETQALREKEHAELRELKEQELEALRAKVEEAEADAAQKAKEHTKEMDKLRKTFLNENKSTSQKGKRMVQMLQAERDQIAQEKDAQIQKLEDEREQLRVDMERRLQEQMAEANESMAKLAADRDGLVQSYDQKYDELQAALAATREEHEAERRREAEERDARDAEALAARKAGEEELRQQREEGRAALEAAAAEAQRRGQEAADRETELGRRLAEEAAARAKAEAAGAEKLQASEGALAALKMKAALEAARKAKELEQRAARLQELEEQLARDRRDAEAAAREAQVRLDEERAKAQKADFEREETQRRLEAERERLRLEMEEKLAAERRERQATQDRLQREAFDQRSLLEADRARLLAEHQAERQKLMREIDEQRGRAHALGLEKQSIEITLNGQKEALSRENANLGQEFRELKDMLQDIQENGAGEDRDARRGMEKENAGLQEQVVYFRSIAKNVKRDYQLQLERLEREKAALREQLERKRDKKRRYKQQLAEAVAAHARRLQDAEAAARQGEQELQALHASKADAMEALREARDRVEKGLELEGALRQASKDYRDLLEEAAALRQAREAARAEKQRLGAKLELAVQSLEIYQQECDGLERELGAAEYALAQAERGRQQNEAAFADMERKLGRSERARARGRADTREAGAQWDGLALGAVGGGEAALKPSRAHNRERHFMSFG